MNNHDNGLKSNWTNISNQIDKFKDIENSNEWYLFNLKTNKKEPILVPSWHSENSLIWRWSV